MATRTFVVTMRTEGFLDAGIYKCLITYTNQSNQVTLSNELCLRVDEFAQLNNGQLESRVKTRPSPLSVLYTEIFGFVNLDSMLRFAQQVGYVKSTRAINFIPDYASLQALL
jgi:hypothetical protein